MQEQRYSTPTWGDYFTPQHCEVCGRTVMPAGMDWRRMAAEQPANPWLDSWSRTWGDVYESWVQAVNTSWAPYTPQPTRTTGKDRPGKDRPGMNRPDKHMHRCQDCEQNDCDCRCCVGDADLLVNARVGERRVIPLVIENDSRRERQIELELSDWSTHHGEKEIKVTGQLLPPLTFTLAACSEQKVTLMVQALESKDTDKERFGDVDGCQIYYADLRIKGCDVRPVRIALALLSRECAPLTIECRCNCC